ncbi:MAG: SEL1-like repeat protein [Rhodoplanes sp.]
MYAKGEGVPLDNVLAHMWFNLAAVYFTSRLSRDRAIALRDTIARKLSPAEIGRAQEMAREWQSARERESAPEWRHFP